MQKYIRDTPAWLQVLCAQSLSHVWLFCDCSPPVSPAHGIFQERIEEWVAISFSNKL